MRDFDKNPYTLRDRVKRRFLMEDPDVDHDSDIGKEWDWSIAQHVMPKKQDRIASFETAHPANLLAQTAVLRRDARDTTGPDLDAFAAAFSTALTQHDEEYL